MAGSCLLVFNHMGTLQTEFRGQWKKRFTVGTQQRRKRESKVRWLTV